MTTDRGVACNDKSTLPPEILLEILARCDGPTIVRSRSVSQTLYSIANKTVVKRNTFGRLPDNVMVNIFAHLAEDVDLGHWGITESYRCVLRSHCLNKTYNLLLRQHPIIATLLFRGGNVRQTMASTGVYPVNITLHPIFNTLAVNLYDAPHDILVNPYSSAMWSQLDQLTEVPQWNEFATRPPFATIWLLWYDDMDSNSEHEVPIKIENKDGAKVQDVMRAYCNQLPAGQEYSHCFWEGIKLVGSHSGGPSLEVIAGS